MPLLAFVSHKRRGAVIAYFRQESQYSVRKRYKALTVPGKQLLLKRDLSSSHISTEYSVYTNNYFCGAQDNVWQEETREKDLPVLHDSRSRYVERNDIIMRIYSTI